MESKKLLQITFGSFIKLISIVFFCLGVLGGIIVFITSIFGGNASVHIGPLEIYGIPAGVVSIFLFPIIFYLVGIVIAILSFLPFSMYLKKIKGIDLKIMVE